MPISSSSSVVVEEEEVVLNCSKPQQQSAEKKASSSMMIRSTASTQQQPAEQQLQAALKCPRCDSSNTKFCYYNNYSLSQPRYFCKGCRRYWTQGGSLRNVPVGGGCRKTNKRPFSSSSSSSSSSYPSSSFITSKKIFPHDHQIFTTNPLPTLTFDSNDLTLAFSRLHKQQQPTTTMQLGFDHQILLGNPTTTTTTTTNCDTSSNTTLGNPNTSTTDNNNNNNGSSTGFLDALRSGFLETQNGFHNFQYGFGNGDQLDNQSSGGGGIEHLPYQEITSTTTTTTRTEDYFGKGGGGGEGRDGAAESRGFVMNFPWHQFSSSSSIGGNDDGNNMLGGIIDSSSLASGTRDHHQYWNNGFGSSWHGLVNSL